MKVTAIETLRTAELPNILWVRVHTDEGLVGLGETFFGAETVEAYIHEYVAPRLIGQDPTRIDAIARDLVGYLGFRSTGAETRGNSAIDIALWDLKGKILNRPVYDLLGGPHRDRIRVYANGWYTNPGTPEQNRAEAREVVARGFDAMKFDPFGQRNYYLISPEEAQLAEDRVAAVR